MLSAFDALFQREILTPEVRILTFVATLTSANRAKILPELLPYFTKYSLPIRSMEETILQCYLFVGFPAVIEALHVLPIEHLAPQEKPEFSVEAFRIRGTELCKKIYGNNFEALIGRMNRYSPTLADWMIVEGYGKVLSRDGIDIPTRELINVSILTTTGYHRQLHSHIRGASNVGAGFEQMEEVIKQTSLVITKERSQEALELLGQIRSQ